MKRTLSLLVAIASLASCTRQIPQEPDTSSMVAAAATSQTNGEGSGFISESYPTDGVFEAAAEAQSAALDARCADLPMAASLQSRRPAGVGCPRENQITEAP